MRGGDDAGNALEVGRGGDVMKAGGGAECGNGFGLAVADFEEEPAAGLERGEGGGDEAAVDGESIGAGEERGVGLEVADFGVERGEVGVGDVGRVGDDEVEDFTGDGGEEIALEEADGDSVALCVFFGESECGRGEVDGGDAGLGQVVRERDGEDAGAGADVQDLSWRDLTRGG